MVESEAAVHKRLSRTRRAGYGWVGFCMEGSPLAVRRLRCEECTRVDAAKIRTSVFSAQREVKSRGVGVGL